MSFVIKIIEAAEGRYRPEAGKYVKALDFEGNNGRSKGVFTPDPHLAMKFRSAGEALISGKPNR